MKRLLLHLFVGFLAFSIGSTIASLCEFHKVRVVGEQRIKLFESALVNQTFISPRELPPNGYYHLSEELQRIDEIYAKRCPVPGDNSHGGWPAIKELDRFSVCNDEWAEARRKAISAKRTRYLVIY
jgi:hypothetical protein